MFASESTVNTVLGRLTSTAVAQEMLSYVKANVFPAAQHSEAEEPRIWGGWGGWVAGRQAGWLGACAVRVQLNGNS